jgi:hypothetical protein
VITSAAGTFCCSVAMLFASKGELMTQQRLKRRSDRLLILAERARQFADGQDALLADLYREHAAICEHKAAVQDASKKELKRSIKATDG